MRLRRPFGRVRAAAGRSMRGKKAPTSCGELRIGSGEAATTGRSSGTFWLGPARTRDGEVAHACSKKASNAACQVRITGTRLQRGGRALVSSGAHTNSEKS